MKIKTQKRKKNKFSKTKKSNRKKIIKKNKKKQFGGNQIKEVKKSGSICKITYENGDYYDGYCDANNRKIVNGEMIYNNGDKYKGSWDNDLKRGPGRMTYLNGTEYYGIWRDDKPYEGTLTKDGVIIKKYSEGKDINILQSNKPIELKSPAYTIQLSGTCVAHALARSVTRTLLVYTLIDGSKTDEMFIAIYCFFLNEAVEGKQCNGAGDTTKVITSFTDKLKTSVDKLFEYKYSDIPCEFVIGGCLISSVNNQNILTFNETEKQLFLDKFNKIKDGFESYGQKYEYNILGNNYPTEGIKNALNKKLQPMIMIWNCPGLPNGGAHAMVLRSWGKEYNTKGIEVPTAKNTFCFKNTWINSTYKCIDNVNMLCNYLYKQRGQSNRFLLVFVWFDFDLNKIKESDQELYNTIIERMNSLYKTVYDD